MKRLKSNAISGGIDMRKFIYHSEQIKERPHPKTCTDVCPYIEIRAIGSAGCRECPFFVVIDDVKKIVYCTGDEHPLKED